MANTIENNTMEIYIGWTAENEKHEIKFRIDINPQDEKTAQALKNLTDVYTALKGEKQ